MTVQPEEYRALLIQLINLQRKLIRAYEAEVRAVSSLPPIFPEDTQRKLEELIRPGRTISQILRDWPDDVHVETMHLWVRPVMGVMRAEGRDWLFQLHGVDEVRFTGLPPGLDPEVLQSLREGRLEVLTDLQLGPSVDVKYLKGGRADGVSTWTVSIYAESVGSKISELSDEDHTSLFQDLVSDGFLLFWPNNYSRESGRYVLAPESKAKQQRSNLLVPKPSASVSQSSGNAYTVRSLKQMFADYFRKKYEAYSKSEPPIYESRPRGWLEECRAEAFQAGYSPSLKRGVLWSKLRGKVYEIAHFELSAILAHYGNDTILWLDDHSDDTDFEEFIRREHLLTWLPHRMDELLDLLIGTKFSFLGQPQLIRSVSEIPRLTEREASLQAKSQEGEEALLEEDKCLANIADQIQPPSCVPEQNGAFQLDFCIWTRILGRVVKIHCTFGLDDTFSYEDVQLAYLVGRFYVPR